MVEQILPQARIIGTTSINIPEARNIAVKETYLVYWDSDILAPPSAPRVLFQQNKPIAPRRR